MTFMPKSSAALLLEQKVQLLIDERDIRDVIYRFCRALNRCDVEIFKSCFFEDTIDHHEPYFVSSTSQMVVGFEEEHRKVADVVVYSVHQILIDLDGDVARTESQVSSAKTWQAKTIGGDATVRLSGMRWLDRFERRSGEWRIAERWFIGEWGFFAPAPTLKEALGNYPAGTGAKGVATNSGLRPIPAERDRTDLSYRF